MTESGAWRPLLEGKLAEEAKRAVADVAAALADPDGPHTAPLKSEPTVAGGTGGLALLFTYLAEALQDEASADVAGIYVDRIVDAVPEAVLRPGLYSGLVGVGWTLEHLNGRLIEPDPGDDPNQPIDEALLEALKTPWTGDYDLINGLVGLSVYAFERLPRPTAEQLAGLILLQISNAARQTPGGTTWHTRPELLPEWQRERFPQGYFNLGVAHGIPGVIWLLGELCGRSLLTSEARPLLEGAVRWLLAQALPAGTHSHFPNQVAEGGAPSKTARLAWCYGDAGVAVTLLKAAREAGQETWEQEAVRIALAAAARDPETCGVVDAGLCHGSAGLGHLFNRLYQATGREELAEASRFWFERTLAFRRPGEGVGGFFSWMQAPEQPGQWHSDPGFLTGAGGIALALLGAVTPLAPEWDRLLLAAVPPVAPS